LSFEFIKSNTVNILPVIMAGGSGTRLWPLSRALYPKQFLAFEGTTTLFQGATQRLAALDGGNNDILGPCVVVNDEHRFLVLDQLREIGVKPAATLLEPAGRNTAPALTLAALWAVDGDQDDPVMVMTPADQVVADQAAFAAAASLAIEHASNPGVIVTLGVVPDRPETGYGYIRAARRGGGAVDVAAFVEKPDAATAQRYLNEGGYCWNSGMFVLRASTWLRALARWRPDIDAAARGAWRLRKTDGDFVRPDRAAFDTVPAESIDYAVMERCVGPEAVEAGLALKMVPLSAGWNDLGAWNAVWQTSPQDSGGNSVQGDAIVLDSRDCLVRATKRLVGVVGLKGVTVVETADAVLVADNGASQQVKEVVRELERRGRSEGTLHRRVHRPWGWYESIDGGPRFQVKRIMVKPKAALSLQLHHHRAEHWIVVQGTAEVTCGERVTLLTENQSTYIPLGERHRLANPGTIPLEIVEVQSGSYLGEDDIVRLQDTYGRA
jgi:mannose-1-phosphate guanylyltransferase/mannose-6-phosphate isomerase